MNYIYINRYDDIFKHLDKADHEYNRQIMTMSVYAHVHFTITKVRSRLQDDNIVLQRTLNENEYHVIYDKY